MSRPDWRSPEAAEYRKLYKSARWLRAREQQLAKQPLCERCLEQDLVTPATVVNHRTPHKGDAVLFFDPNNHESTCKPCHDGPIQRAELKGFSGAVDDGGWPTDPHHRANRTSR